MRTRVPALVLALLAVAFGASPAAAETHEVLIVDPNQTFNPDVVDAVVGDQVHWSRPLPMGLPHNVFQDDALFSSGEPTEESIDFTVTPSAGRFHYYCVVHGTEGGGMDGNVNASPTMADNPDGRPFTVRWASNATDTGEVFDVRFMVDDGDFQTWKTDTERFAAAFGKNRRPVRVRAGHTYTFQARSQLDPDDPGARSRWSPPLEVVVEA